MNSVALSKEVKLYLEDLINIVVLITVLNRPKFYLKTEHAEHVQVDHHLTLLTKIVLEDLQTHHQRTQDVHHVLNTD